MGKEIRYEKVEADEWALLHRVRVKFDGTWIRCNGSERECFVPWKATGYAFLRRIHTVDNAAIPYQLHAEVVNRIIDNQGRFYPWLIDAREHILKVLTSRIPYYVGPLDSTDHGNAGENGTRFAWVKRLAGHEDAFVSRFGENGKREIRSHRSCPCS